MKEVSNAFNALAMIQYYLVRIGNWAGAGTLRNLNSKPPVRGYSSPCSAFILSVKSFHQLTFAAFLEGSMEDEGGTSRIMGLSN